MRDGKLNICIVQPNGGTYSETFIRNHIDHLPANIFNAYGPWFPEFDGEHQSLSKGYLKRNFFSKFLSGASKVLPHMIFIRLPSTITGLPLQSNKLLKQSFKYYLKQKKIDVVLAEYGIKGVIVMDTCKELKIPLVVHFHGYDAHYKPTLLEFEPSYPALFMQAAAIISVSKYMHNALLNMSAPSEKTFLIHYGVDVNLFPQSESISSNPILISVGRFTDKKAPHLTILAFAKAVKIFPEAKLIMIGDGPLMESLIILSNALELNNNIEFRGIQTASEVAAAMQQARAFVLHSVVTSEGDAEGTPNVILEAASSGLPVISTLHAGIPDVIEHGVSGFLVKENDVKSMAEYMILLLKDKELAAKMGKAGRKHIEQNFQLHNQLSKLMSIISKSVNQN